MPIQENNYKEKRNFIRMFIDAKITITDPDTRKTYEGDSKNLSGDGVMFTTKTEFKVQQQLQVDISSQQSKLPPLSASFEVIRVQKIENDLFEVAGKINQMN